MPGGEDHAASVDTIAGGGDDAGDGPAREHEVRDPRREADLAPTVADRRAERLHHLREPVRADVRVRVDQDVGRRAVADEDVEDGPDRAPLRRARVELAVGERAGAAFAEAVVALRVDDARAGDPGDGVTAPANVGAALEDDRAEATLDERERGEEAGGPGADDDGGRSRVHVA